MSIMKPLFCLIAIAFLPSLVNAAESVAPLPKLKIDSSRIGVTGISSGAFMAIQMQMAYPEIFKRAGIVAGGPYACAEDIDASQDWRQMYKCMDDLEKGYEASKYMTDANITEWARRASLRAAGYEGAPSRFAGLNGGVAYFLHGTKDAVVLPIVAEAAVKEYSKLKFMTFYGVRQWREASVNIKLIDDASREFGHTFPTRAPRLASNDDCNNSVYPYIGHCGIDGAGLIFSKLYGQPVQPAAEQPTEQVVSFDQTAIVAIDPSEADMAAKGYAYIPKACTDGQNCGVMVALHGCNQAAESLNPYPASSPDKGPVGDRFATLTGFNRWADAYRVIMLYPQVHPTPSGVISPISNYNGCWDWWGYTGKNYDLRSGKQPTFIVNMLKAIGYSADD